MKNLQPKIYVACLAAYNSGYLHGDWIDAHQDVNALYEEIKTMLLNSPIKDAEEWAIHDYSDFGGILIEESTNLEKIAELVDFLVNNDELSIAVLAHTYGDIDAARSLLEDCYHGEYKSEEDFAISLAQDTMEIPEHLDFYIDYEKMARDLFINDFFSIEVNHKVYVFSYH